VLRRTTLLYTGATKQPLQIILSEENKNNGFIQQSLFSSLLCVSPHHRMLRMLFCISRATRMRCFILLAVSVFDVNIYQLLKVHATVRCFS